MKNHIEQGRTMLEMIGVVAILAVMTVGAATAISFSLMLFEANHMHAELEQIARGVTDLYSWNRNFSGLTMGVVCENDILARSCVGNGSTQVWTNVFDGEITVEPDNNSFLIRYTEVPERVCRQLLCDTKWTDVEPKNPPLPDRNSSICEPNCTSVMTFRPRTF